MLLGLETPRIAGEYPSARGRLYPCWAGGARARPAVNPLQVRASPRSPRRSGQRCPWNGRQRARVLSHGSAWLWAFPTALPMASAQAAEMSPFFAAPRAIEADLWSCFITRVTLLFAFRSLPVPDTCQ